MTILGYLINEYGTTYSTVYLLGTHEPENAGDVWNQEDVMTEERFDSLVSEGWARAIN
jgi:hypothetical protein